MNIVFLEPKPSGTQVFQFDRIPLHGLPIFAAMAKKRGHEVKVFCECLASIPRRNLKRADVVVISILTINALRAYELIALIREVNPECLIIAGGPHATFMPKEVLSKGANIVGRGEGEEIFEELLDWLEKGMDLAQLHNIKGLSFRDGRDYVHTPDRGFVENLSRFPFPDFSLIKRGLRRITKISLQMARGCPFGCNFCNVIQMYGRQIRVKATAGEMYNELERLVNERPSRYPAFLWWLLVLILGVPKVFIIDDNFFVNREVVREFLQLIISKGLKVRLSVQARIEIGNDPELLSLFRRAGGYRMYIGYESANPDIRQFYSKGGKSLTTEELAEYTRVIRYYGIAIHGMFVIGGDLETPKTARETLSFALANSIDTAQFLILTPLPGTDQFRELKAADRIIDYCWDHYGAHHAVFQPMNFTPSELEDLMQELTLEFYSWKVLARKLSEILIWRRTIMGFTCRQIIRSMAIHFFACIIVRKKILNP